MLKKIFRFILHGGAVACALAGLGVIYAGIANFREPYHDPDWPYQLALATIYVCLAFTPAFMFLKGLKTKTWHWVLTTIAEVIVLPLALYILLALTLLILSGGGVG